MHPISRPCFCGPRSPIDEWARSGPRRRPTIWGTWPPNLSPRIGIIHPGVFCATSSSKPHQGIVWSRSWARSAVSTPRSRRLRNSPSACGPPASPRRMCAGRCGSDAASSRPMGYEAPFTCSRPPSFRCGWLRCALPTASQLAWMHLEPAQHDAIVTAIWEALDGRCLTREQLGDEVASRVGSWALERLFPAFSEMWPRWRGAIGGAALAGLLCFGPSQGNKVTFVRPDQWLEDWSEVVQGDALAEVLRRYLAAYGPATLQEFAQWFAVGPTAALAASR